MKTTEIKDLAVTRGEYLNATADRLAAAIPAMEQEVSRLYEAVLTAEVNGKGLRVARNRWRAAKGRLDTRVDDVSALRNQAADLQHYMRYHAGRRFTNRPTMIDLPAYRLPTGNGRSRGTDPIKGRSMVTAGESRTTFDKPYGYAMGLTAVGYTTDLTYPVNGSNRASDRATGHTRTRSRQVHGPEPTQTGLRLSLQSEYLFWKVGEYHRKLIRRPAGKDADGNQKYRTISRPAYDKAVGYPTDIPTTIRRLRSIQKAIADPVEYAGNGWVLTGRPRYSGEQIDRLIADLKAVANGHYADRFTAAQFTVADLYGYADLESRIKAVTGKAITITRLSQWHYWNGRVIRESRQIPEPAAEPEPDPTTDQPQISLTGHGKAPYRPCKPMGIGDAPARVRKAKNGRIMVDGRFAPAWTPKVAGTDEGSDLADQLRADRETRWADWWDRNTKA